MITDGRTVGLVGADGSIDWWCVPTMDAPPVFDRILDGQGGGRFSISPTEPFSVVRSYRPDSNVLETEFRTASGRARLTDSLNSGHAGRLPWSELARRVEGLEGEVELRVDVSLGSRFDQSERRDAVVPDDGAFQLGPLLMQLRTTDDCAVVEPSSPDDAGASPEEDAGTPTGACSLRIRTSEGSRSTVAMLATHAEPLMDSQIQTIDARIDRSDRQWQAWTDDLTYDGPYAERVRRSALALKLLLFSPTGAIAAAATTSLPEVDGGEKNYDYRAAWLRDAAYSVKALLRIGGTEEAQAGFAWMMETIERHLPQLRVFYTLDGELPGDEREVALPGYRGATPVRVGNSAREQRQLSCYGDVIETAELFARRGNHLDARTCDVLTLLADRCCEEWELEDAGIWELHDDHHYTMSKIGCWLALDRAARLAESGQLDGSNAHRWRAESERIVAWIDEHCWSEERQTYVQYAGGEALDAALLLATRWDFPRMDRLEATLKAVEDELLTGALVHRYSGMPEVEGAFLATSFWRVEALAFVGRPDEARTAMEDLLDVTGCNLGLMTEMVDPESGAWLGNMPQGLSHLAMIHAALAIQECSDR